MKGMKTGGRSKGTPNRRTQEIVELAERLGFKPFELLAHIAMGNWEALGYKSPTVLKVSKDGGVFEEDRISVDHRLQASKEATQYLYPKLKAIEHSGSVDSETTLRAVTRQDLINAIKKDPFINIEVEEDGNGKAPQADSNGVAE